MFARLTRSLLLLASFVLFAFPSAAAAATVTDPAGDVTACTGECSSYDQDLKSLSIATNGANLEVTVGQFGTGGIGPFTSPSACGYYWPIVEIYTASADPAGPPAFSAYAHNGDFAIGSFNCPASPGGIGHQLVVPPTIPNPSTTSLATVTTTNPDLNTVTYSVPLAAVGGTQTGMRVRAWQTSDMPEGAVDVVPDTGVLGADGSISGGGGGGPAGGGGGGGGGGAIVPPLNNLNSLPKSPALKSTFSGNLDLLGPADQIDLSLTSGALPAVQTSKSKVVGKKTLKNVGPGKVKFSIPISKSFRKGIKKGKKIKLTFKAVVHAPGIPPKTLTKVLSFKMK